MIPNDWAIMSLGEICSNNLQTGPFRSQLHSHEYVENGIPVLMPKDLNNCKADLNSSAKITLEKANALKKHILKNGDLLFSRRGDITKFALIDEKSEGSICGTGCLKARPNENHSSKFLAYFLQRDSVKQWLEQNAVGQTMPNMNTEILKELPLVSASSRKEEEKIAEILSTWDKAIETVEKLVTNSQQQKKSLMQQLLTGQKRLLDDNGVEFEDEWELIEIGKVLSESREPSKDNNPTNRLTVRLNFKGIEAREYRGTEAIDSTAHFVRRAGQFIYGKQNIHKGAFGIIPSHLNKYESSQDLPSFDFTRKCNPNWFFYYLSQESFYLSLEDKMSGTGSKRLNPKTFFKIKILYPTIKEQEKIAQVLTLADREIDLYQQQLHKLKLEKKSLMQQLLTGQKRVKI